jgi:hypothetical protein
MKNTFTKCYFSTSKKEYNFEETRDKNIKIEAKSIFSIQMQLWQMT